MWPDRSSSEWRLRGKTLKSVLMLIAVGALANMLIIYLNPVNHLENMDLLITGSFFDVVFYLGALTLRIPDAAPPLEEDALPETELPES